MRKHDIFVLESISISDVERQNRNSRQAPITHAQVVKLTPVPQGRCRHSRRAGWSHGIGVTGTMVWFDWYNVGRDGSKGLIAHDGWGDGEGPDVSIYIGTEGNGDLQVS